MHATPCQCPACCRARGLGVVPDFLDSSVDAATLALLQSPQFQPVLEAIKTKAREGVVEETKANALTLLALSASAGAVGGLVFRGSRGAIAAGVIAYLSVTRLMKGHV
jgi:hypothetical protein